MLPPLERTAAPGRLGSPRGDPFRRKAATAAGRTSHPSPVERATGGTQRSLHRHATDRISRPPDLTVDGVSDRTGIPFAMPDSGSLTLPNRFANHLLQQLSGKDAGLLRPALSDPVCGRHCCASARRFLQNSHGACAWLAI